MENGIAWSPPRADASPRSARLPRAPTLEGLLGGALRPPPEGLSPPSFAPLKDKVPPALPEGSPIRSRTPDAAATGSLAPPAAAHACPERPQAPAHWHAASTPAWRHDGAAWGRAVEGGWAWLLRDHGRWWTVAGGVQRMVRHEGFWWWRTRDGWFLLHEGEPWAHRLFADLGRYGILHPPSGLRVVYGAGGRRMAVLWPGGTWLLLDARTGAELARGASPAGRPGLGPLKYAISP